MEFKYKQMCVGARATVVLCEATFLLKPDDDNDELKFKNTHTHTLLFQLLLLCIHFLLPPGKIDRDREI